MHEKELLDATPKLFYFYLESVASYISYDGILTFLHLYVVVCNAYKYIRIGKKQFNSHGPRVRICIYRKVERHSVSIVILHYISNGRSVYFWQYVLNSLFVLIIKLPVHIAELLNLAISEKHAVFFD